MNKKTKWILISAIGVVVVFLLVRMMVGSGDGGIKVTAEEASRRTIVETIEASGKLYPETEIRVSSPIFGEVTELLVKEGDSVTKGQVVARIRGERQTANQRVSMANVPPGFESLVRSMQAPSSSSPTSAVIKAPISGTIISLSARQGERLGGSQLQGLEMMRIADMSNLVVRVDVNENDIIKIGIGDSADVMFEAYNKRKFKGTVRSITNNTSRREPQSFLSNDVTNYEVHVKLNPDSYSDLFDSTNKQKLPFRPGMNASAEIKTARKENVISIPVGAVVSKNSAEESIDQIKSQRADETLENDGVTPGELQEVVYVIKSADTVERRVVKTGLQDLDYFEITQGLKEGERVVTAPYNVINNELKTGKRVQTVKREQLFTKD